MDLHLYVISHSKFLLTTNSGPSVIAWSLGTPVLQTNTTSIARNILRSSKESLFLPKHYRGENGRELTFGEIAQGRLGYAESTVSELARLGIQVLENSSIEIYEATKDILRLLDRSESSNNLMEQLNQIREETSAIGFGNVAPSFLQSKPSWLSI
jgi:putative glycosyltransferase (TIGR04372 family)